MIIKFVTANKGKFKFAQEALKNTGIILEQEIINTPEIQDEDVSKIAKYSAEYVANLLNKPAIKVDVSFEIAALNGFPGPFSKFINQWISPEKLLKLMEDETNRNAKFVEGVAFCQPNKKPISYRSETNGVIAFTVNGENGWGIDKIFIPNNFDVTLATLSNEQRDKVWNQSAWIKLAKYLKNKPKF